jgi:fused signal recognition particle receptor
MFFFKRKRNEHDAKQAAISDNNGNEPSQNESEITDASPSDINEASEQASSSEALTTAEAPNRPDEEASSDVPERSGWLQRVRSGLSRTSQTLGSGIADVFLGKKEIDDELLEDLETQLLMADVGMDATAAIIDRLTERVGRKELNDAQSLHKALIDELSQSLEAIEAPLNIQANGEPFVMLVVGVNGVGKTTTIGKIAKQLKADGKEVMLAAGDTFRAAAVEQLQTWGERNDVPVVAQHTGADSASVIFDAVQSAKAKGVDVVIADTAGRLQNKANLMEELEKVVRVIKKVIPSAPHEVLLVLDAGTGQNALSQAAIFQEAVGVSGLALTKLDGTAKGGVIFALAQQFKLPVRYIGVGEGIDDLQPFRAKPFTEAIFKSPNE